jgi:hypothetical protein
VTLSLYGKKLIARVQFDKGRAFVGAALLLKPHTQNESYKYVYLHLVCQGIELILKGLLLAKDYNNYRPKLKKKFGHDIISLAKVTLCEFSLNPLTPEIERDLSYLSQQFSAHSLRYSSAHDIFINPNSIAINPVMRRLGACIRLAMRHLDRT